MESIAIFLNIPINNLLENTSVSKSSVSDSLVSFSQNNTQSNDSVKIPVYDEVYVSAGQGFINDEHITRYIELG